MTIAFFVYVVLGVCHYITREGTEWPRFWDSVFGYWSAAAQIFGWLPLTVTELTYALVMGPDALSSQENDRVEGN